MTFDGRDDYTVMFGGAVGEPGSDSNQTWIFEGNRWFLLQTALSPPATNSAMLTYDAADGYVVLYEGIVPHGGPQTWTYAAGVWTNRTGPGPDFYWPFSAMTFDYRDGYVVAAGPTFTTQGHGWTWKFSGGSWTNISSTAGPAPATGVIAWDSTGNSSVMVDENSPPNGPCNDTWIFLGGRWNHTSVNGPCLFGGFQRFLGMVDDPEEGGPVLFGALCLSGYVVCSNAWVYRQDSWAKVNVSSLPSVYEFDSLAYDPLDHQVVLFGGEASGSPPSRSSETWVFQNGNWTLVPMPQASTWSFQVILEVSVIAVAGAVLAAVLLVRRRRRRREQ